MKTLRHVTFYFIIFSLLCAITTLSESAPGGTCEVGDVIQPGESCTYPGTNDVFSVDDEGRARFLFFTAGGNLIIRNSNINGRRYTLVTEHSEGGGRRITELAGDTAPPQPDPDPQPDPEAPRPLRELLSLISSECSGEPAGLGIDITMTATIEAKRDLESISIQGRIGGEDVPGAFDTLDELSAGERWTFTLEGYLDSLPDDQTCGYYIEARETDPQPDPEPTSVSASATPALTETTLDEGVVTLTLTGLIYEQDISKIRDAVTVSGINGVTIDTATVQRLSDREVTVELNFDDTDFDADTPLTFSVASGALVNYTGDAFTIEMPVAALKESVSASVVSPLTEATLDGSIVTLLLTAAAFEQDISKIRDAVTVAGIDGVTIDTATVQRLSDRRIQVELDYDGTDFIRDTALTFTLTSKAIANHNGEVTTEIPVTANSNEDVLTIFWTDEKWSDSNIRRANLDMANLEVSNIETLITGLDGPVSIALDVSGGKMYWTDRRHNREKIQRANFDGSNVEDLVTGLDEPQGIALDVEAGKMYWTDETDIGKIQRANLDGSNIEDLVTRLGVPKSIALDVEAGKMYWTNWNRIQRANFDGSNVEDLVTIDESQGIALDVEAGKMYWTGGDGYRIRRANLDGSNVEGLVTSVVNPQGIALDVEAGKMYWADRYTEKIQRANFDGSNVEDLVTGLDRPTGIAIVMSSLVNPTEEPTIVKEDVNRDGVVDVQDLAYVGLQYGKTGTNAADVNGDEVVNVDDFILVAAAIDEAIAAAPAARAQVHSHFTKAQLQGWLTEARASGNTSRTYQRGIAVVEHLLALIAPVETALLANYPNPFNPETWVPYQLSKSADVTLTIYAVDGHVVRALALGHQTAGMYQSRSRAAYWDGRNAVGEPVASGLYFYTLTAGDFSATRKMLIRK